MASILATSAHGGESLSVISRSVSYLRSEGSGFVTARALTVIGDQLQNEIKI